MTKIKNIESKVEYLLRKKPETRVDDFVLICEFKDTFFEGYSLIQCFLSHKELDFPSCETITRCRRKLQQKYPELAKEQIVELRNEKVKEFKEYAKS